VKYASQYADWCGFSDPEDNHIWTDGNHACIQLRVSPPATDLVLQLWVYPLIARNLHSQTARISINDKPIGTLKMRNPGKYSLYSLKIPKSIVNQDVVKVDLYLPNAASPDKLGINKDKRLLATALRWLSIDEKRQ
jgi:hypothetical protein